MLPTVQLLRQWFGVFSPLYFGGCLPEPRLALSKSRTRLGSMSCRRVRTLTGWRATGFSIHISVYYDCDERTYQTVLLHEMIHYYIAYKQLKDQSAHGPLFRSIMQRINNDGWHITISTDTRGWTVRQGMNHTRTRLLLMVLTQDGQRYLSVVAPSAAQRIEAELRVQPTIKQRKWYVSSDSHFATYPVVRSLRGRRMNDASWSEVQPLLQPFTLP